MLDCVASVDMVSHLVTVITHHCVFIILWETHTHTPTKKKCLRRIFDAKHKKQICYEADDIDRSYHHQPPTSPRPIPR